MTSSEHAKQFRGFTSEEILEEFCEAAEVIIPKYPQSQEQVFERAQMGYKAYPASSRKA